MQTNVKRIRKRLGVLLVIASVLIILLVSRVGYWSLYKGEWLQQKAETQWIKDVPVSAKRGSILDRNKNTFAQSASSDTVVVLPEKVQDANLIADFLSEVLQMPREEIYAKASDQKKKEVWVKRQISAEQSGQIEEKIQAKELAGVKLISDITRYYPNKELAAQVIGYTNADGLGQTGIEKRYNSILEGRQGRMVAETDKNKNDIATGQQMFIEPSDGQSVVLTIDEVIQSFLEGACKSLQDTGATTRVQGIVMDVSNGEILAMTNIPQFDLNNPPREDGELLMEVSRNNVTALSFSPGSIFRIFTMAAALDSGLAQQTFECTGEITIGGQKIVCSQAHGTQNLEQSILNECSVAAAQQAEILQKETFYEYLGRMGFGEKTGIDFSADTAGDVMALKYATQADVGMMGAGNTLRVSQLQMANALAALVNGGTLYTPKLVLELCDVEGNTVQTFDSQVKGQAVSAQTSEAIKAILNTTVGTQKGSAAHIPGYTTGAVYGSAQMVEGDVVVPGKEVSTFAAYGTGSAPRYLVMISAFGVEKGETSDILCGPYVKQTLEEILRYRNVGLDDQEARSGQKITVPNVVGMELQQAIDALRELGLTYTADGEGKVTAQIPAAEEEVYQGGNVALTMETKEEPDNKDNTEVVTVPDFTGLSLTEARDKAIESGLKFVALGTGKAGSQFPLKDTPVPKGSSVTITFHLQVDGKE